MFLAIPGADSVGFAGGGGCVGGWGVTRPLPLTKKFIFMVNFGYIWDTLFTLNIITPYVYLILLFNKSILFPMNEHKIVG